MSKPYHRTINYCPLQDLRSMKAVAIFICLIGTAFAIPNHPLNHRRGTHQQEIPEKTEDTHPETPNEESVGYVDKGDFLTRDKSLKAEASVPDAEYRDELQTTRKQERTGSEHQVKNHLRSSSFHALHKKLGLASDNQDSDSGSSVEEQSSSEHYPFRRHEKHSNAANQHVLGNAEKPVDALSLSNKPNGGKRNKNTVGLPEKSSGSDGGGGGVEKEDDDWSGETSYRAMKHRGHQMNQDNQYKREHNENSMQSDEILGDSSQSTQIIRRHSEKFDLEEEERERSQKQPYKEETSFSQNTQEQDDKWQSQDKRDNVQVNSQSDDDTAIKRQDTEDSHANDDDEDSGDVESEEDLSNAWKVAAYDEEERIQSNDQENTSTEHERDGTSEDDTAVPAETKDYQDLKIKDHIYSEQGDYRHEPLNTDSKRQPETSNSAQSTNSTESEDKVKTTGSSYGEMETAINRSEKALLDPCRNSHCRRGRICSVDHQGKPSCICQDPAACPPTKDYEHVCGTDNKTYDGMCQLFGTKCQLEGTKMGHQLHLDYMGSCKYIPHCTDYEVNQFPLRMRDWLKNILVQYYESDLGSTGFLTEKQRNKVKKMYQNDKRLAAGNHTVELLLHDFEKNYHMYVYPVHWQFHQLDQHPVDRLLSPSELASLRASLVPMEHCITRFFHECDGDHDKRIALREWCHCFGIKEEDINENLLF